MKKLRRNEIVCSRNFLQPKMQPNISALTQPKQKWRAFGRAVQHAKTKFSEVIRLLERCAYSGYTVRGKDAAVAVRAMNLAACARPGRAPSWRVMASSACAPLEFEYVQPEVGRTGPEAVRGRIDTNVVSQLGHGQPQGHPGLRPVRISWT